MNSLSWLLYWADTLPGLATGIAFVFSLLFLGMVLLFVGRLVVASETSEYGKEGREVFLKVTTFTPYLMAFSLFMALCTNFVPSKNTIYMIAASEAGERALQTPEFGKLRKLINQTLDEQLKPKEET